MLINEMQFETVGQSITIENIAADEKMLNVTLPSDYKNFLMQFNGGWSIRCETFDRKVRINDWLSVGPIEENDTFLTTNRRIRTNEWKEHVVIAYDIADHFVVMGTSERNKGKISLLNWELSTDPNSAKVLFESFTHFIGELHHNYDT